MPATGGAVVLAEAAFLLAARVAAAAGSLLLAAVAARVLAPAEVGALFYVLAAAWLAAALADLGQQTVLLPELVAARRAVSGDSVGRASPVGRASLPARATRWRERAGRDARPTSRDARPTS
ncbi:MAG: hypothetical protein HY690_03245, partial [Chloroflexi bacterium]|nr:hypothetical protein [Chloroflexota bacterium]